MIYLIEMKMPYTRVRAFKIGSTSNIETRMKQYRTHNPYIELLATIEFDDLSDREAESAYHDMMLDSSEVFRQFGERRNSEWFEVIDKNIIKRVEDYCFYAIENIAEGITEEEADRITERVKELF